MLLLSNADVARLLSMRECMQALEAGLRAQAAGEAVNQLPYATNMPLTDRPERQARYEFKTMLGILPSCGVAALRTSGVLVHRPVRYGSERDERIAGPDGTTVGLVQLFSTRTGEPLAFLPDGVIQGLRVGATYGLATRYLARANATTMGLLGSGWQARFQVQAVQVACDLSLVKVYSPNPAHRARFADQVGKELGLTVRAVESAEEAADGVDILVSATNARHAVVTGNLVEKGMHVAVVTTQELSREARDMADLQVVLSAERYLVYYGGDGQYGQRVPDPVELRHQRELPRLEDIIIGQVSGRTSDDQVTVFWSGAGMGVQFAAVGAHLYERARALGVGREIPTGWFTQELDA